MISSFIGQFLLYYICNSLSTWSHYWQLSLLLSSIVSLLLLLSIHSNYFSLLSSIVTIVVFYYQNCTKNCVLLQPCKDALLQYFQLTNPSTWLTICISLFQIDRNLQDTMLTGREAFKYYISWLEMLIFNSISYPTI